MSVIVNDGDIKLILGDKHTAADKDFLIREGVSHVLNMTPSRTVDAVSGVANYFEKDKRFTYMRCAVFDNRSTDMSPYFLPCLQFIEGGRHHGAVLVHCVQGVSRSVTIVVAWLVKHRRMQVAEALELVVSKRPEASPKSNFLKQLKVFARRQRAALEPRRQPLGPSKPGSTPPQGPTLPPSAACTPPLGPGVSCEECEEAAATVRCATCEVSYCQACSDEAHVNPAIGEHTGALGPLPGAVASPVAPIGPARPPPRPLKRHPGGDQDGGEPAKRVRVEDADKADVV